MYVTSSLKAKRTSPTGKAFRGKGWQERDLLLSASRVWLRLRAFRVGSVLCLSDHAESSVIRPGWQTHRGTFTDWGRVIQVRERSQRYSWKCSARLTPWDMRAVVSDLQACHRVAGTACEVDTSIDFEVKEKCLNLIWPLTIHNTLGQIQCLQSSVFCLDCINYIFKKRMPGSATPEASAYLPHGKAQ